MFNPKYFSVVTQDIGIAAVEVPCGLVDEFGAQVTPNVYTATPVHLTQTVLVTVGPAAGTGANVGLIVITAKASGATTPVTFFFALIANPNE